MWVYVVSAKMFFLWFSFIIDSTRWNDMYEACWVNFKHTVQFTSHRTTLYKEAKTVAWTYRAVHNEFQIHLWPKVCGAEFLLGTKGPNIRTSFTLFDLFYSLWIRNSWILLVWGQKCSLSQFPSWGFIRNLKILLQDLLHFSCLQRYVCASGLRGNNVRVRETSLWLW